ANLQSTADDLASVLKSVGYNRSKPLNVQESDWEWKAQDPRDMASTIRIADPSTSSQLIRGFYDLEQGAWRWTASRVTVSLLSPLGTKQRGAELTSKVTIAEVSLRKLKSMTLSANVGDFALAPETYTTQGNHEYRRELSPSAVRGELVDADFSLDKFLGPPEWNELGVIVTFIGLESK